MLRYTFLPVCAYRESKTTADYKYSLSKHKVFLSRFSVLIDDIHSLACLWVQLQSRIFFKLSRFQLKTN